MTEKEKIKKYLDYKQVSKNKFYLATGLSVGFLDSGKSLGVDKVKIIINEYPDLSLDWLVLDRGPMIRDERSVPMGDQPIVQTRDPRDIEMIADKNKIIQRDEELIATLRHRIEELERRGFRTGDIHVAQPADIPTISPETGRLHK